MVRFCVIMEILNLICILCFILHRSWAAESCAQEGFQSQKGNFWYTCTNKQLVPVACISSQGDRIDEGTKYQDAQTEYQCKRNGGGVLALSAVSCISNGQPIPLDQTFTDDSGHQLKCVKDTSGILKLTMIGCMGDDGRPQPTGGTVTRDGVVYDCQTNGGPLMAKSCLFEGKEYGPGEEIVQSSIWFKCEKSKSGDLAPIVKGCFENNQKLVIGQKFRDFYFLYECQALGGMAMRVGVGCVERYPNGTVTDYKPGDKWFVGVADNRYQITCIKQGLIIRRQGIACYYKTKDGEGLIQGGCMRKVGFQILQCMPSTPQTPNVRIRVTENPTEADWARLRGLGLKEC